MPSEAIVLFAFLAYMVLLAGVCAMGNGAVKARQGKEDQ